MLSETGNRIACKSNAVAKLQSAPAACKHPDNLDRQHGKQRQLHRFSSDWHSISMQSTRGIASLATAN